MNEDSQNLNLSEYDGPDRIVSSYEMDEIVKEQELLKPSLQIKSSMPNLNKMTEGFRGGELITISGPTGEGKTLLLQSFTDAFATNDEQFPLWFSFEMPPGPFIRCFPELPFFFVPRELKAYDWDWFVERCEENDEKNGGKVIMIDHLHFLMGFLQSKNPALEIGQLVRRLKRLAVDHNWIIFLVCHITKIADGVKASMRYIRDSSFITQESDTVIMVQRLTKEDGTYACLTVDKCRWTGCFSQELEARKIKGYLRESKEKYPV